MQGDHLSHIPFNSLVSACVDYCKPHQVVSLITAAVADIVSLLEQRDIAPGTCMQLLTLQMLFPPYQFAKITRSSLLLPDLANNTPAYFCHRAM